MTKKPLESPIDVWRALRRGGRGRRLAGGLEPDDRDKSLVSDLRRELHRRLGRSPEASLDTLERMLRAPIITTESFIEAFFETAAPYAEMMEDLLELFERVGATHGRDELQIEFDFGAVKNALRFDLRTFRRSVEVFRRSRRRIDVRTWTSKELWELHRATNLDDDASSPKALPSDVSLWIDEYRHTKSFPGWEPSPLPVQSEPLRAVLADAWSVWRHFVGEGRRFGPSFERLRDAALQEREPPSVDAGPDRPSASPSRNLWHLHSDHWAQTMLVSLARASEVEDYVVAEQIADRVAEVLSRIDVVVRTVDVLERELLEFLALPFWQRRHELYSAWVMTRIVEAVGPARTKIHVVDSTLRISFGGTHVATIAEGSDRMHLLAEWRTSLANPAGKSRVRGIQPDYSLFLEPLTDAGSSRLEVECKQYRRSSKRNFLDTLRDYARGRPSAVVVLVNYGPIHDSVLAELSLDERDRCRIFGEMRPGRDGCATAFVECVRGVVDGVLSPGAPPVAPVSESIVLCLRWGSVPRDLDLHLRVPDGGTGTEVSFGSRGRLDAAPWAMLSGDISSGVGPETIEIARRMPGTYECWVENYSSESPLTGCGASLDVEIDGRVEHFACPTIGAGSVWHVFSAHSDGTRVWRLVPRGTLGSGRP